MSYTNGPQEITKSRSGASTGLWIALVVAVGMACFLGGYLLAVLAGQNEVRKGSNVISAKDIDQFPAGGAKQRPYKSTEEPGGIRPAPTTQPFPGSGYNVMGDGPAGQRVTTWRSPGDMPPVGQPRVRAATVREEIVIGKPLPNLEFTGIDGREVSIPDMKGKVVIVEFWATWCGPCIKEMPRMKAMYEKWHDKGLEIVGISLDSDRQKLDSYLAENGIPWPQYFDGKGWDTVPSRRFGIRGVPTAILIDREGNVVSRQLKGAELERTLTAMLSTDASEVAAAKAETARIEGIKTVTARGSRVEDQQGNWMEIVALEPNLPATLKPGEKLHIKIKYHLVTDKAVQMWALPSKATSRQDRSSPSDCYYKDEAATGIVDRWFYYPGVATVSEITANMIDSESRKDMLRLNYECSAKWRMPEGQIPLETGVDQ